MNHTLESSRMFPAIAWTLIIFFAFFTYALAVNLSAELDSLSGKVDQLEAQASAR